MRNEYMSDLAYAEYVLDITAQETALHGFVDTLIGISEGQSQQQLTVIQEGVKEKIKNIWEKIKGFVIRIWSKFMDYANRAILTQVEWLEKYRDIILNRKPNDVAIEMSNYTEGFKRIMTNKVQPFASLYNTPKVDDNDEEHKAFKKMILPTYDGTDWKDFALAYFEGGADVKSTNLQALNMTELYTYCHEFKGKILPVLETDQKNLLNTFNYIEQKLNAANKVVEDKTAATNNNQQTSGGSNTNTSTGSSGQQQTQSQGSNQGATTQNASTTIDVDSAYNSFIEALNTSPGSSSSGQSGTTRTPGANQTSGNTSAVNQAKKDIHTNHTGGMEKTSDAQNQQMNDDIAKKQEAELEELSKKLSMYNSVVSTLFTAKVQAAQNIFNDYMKLLKMHVGQQTGNTGENNTAKTTNAFKVPNDDAKKKTND